MRLCLEALWKWCVGGLHVHRIRSRRLVYKENVEFRSNYKGSHFWWCWLLWLNPVGSTRGAFHQPAFMSSCLTISLMCLPCLPSGRTLLFLSDLFVVGRVVSWERQESSELERWERCMRVVRWQVGKGGRVVRWQGGRFAGTWYFLCNCLGVPYNMSIKSLMVCALKFRSGELNSFPG